MTEPARVAGFSWARYPRLKRDFGLGLRQRADRDVESGRAASSTWLSSPRWRGGSTRGGASRVLPGGGHTGSSSRNDALGAEASRGVVR